MEAAALILSSRHFFITLLFMSTPVVTDKWAGNFDCAICRRKRLTADEFSKKVRSFDCIPAPASHHGESVTVWILFTETAACAFLLCGMHD